MTKENSALYRADSLPLPPKLKGKLVKLEKKIVKFFPGLQYKKKEKPPVVRKKTIDLLPFRDIDDNGNIKCENYFMYIYQLSSFDLQNINDNDSLRLIDDKTRFYMSFNDDTKELSLNMPDNTEIQQRYFNFKLANCNNEVQKRLLKQKQYELEFLEKERSTRAYYVFIYGVTLEELETNKATVEKRLSSSTTVVKMSNEKITMLLFKLLNKNSSLLWQPKSVA